MSRVLTSLGLLAVVGMASGCAMCCGPYDDLYPGFGGKWERQDPVAGRVGSRFHDAGGMHAGGIYDGGIYDGGAMMEGEVIGDPMMMDGSSFEGPVIYDQPDSVEYYEVGNAPQSTTFSGPQNHIR